jgi:hypothetical protein
MTEQQISKRELLKKAAWVAPVMLTLRAVPSFASNSSGQPKEKSNSGCRQRIRSTALSKPTNDGPVTGPGNPGESIASRPSDRYAYEDLALVVAIPFCVAMVMVRFGSILIRNSPPAQKEVSIDKGLFIALFLAVGVLITSAALYYLVGLSWASSAALKLIGFWLALSILLFVIGVLCRVSKELFRSLTRVLHTLLAMFRKGRPHVFEKQSKATGQLN